MRWTEQKDLTQFKEEEEEEDGEGEGEEEESIQDYGSKKTWV